GALGRARPAERAGAAVHVDPLGVEAERGRRRGGAGRGRLVQLPHADLRGGQPGALERPVGGGRRGEAGAVGVDADPGPRDDPGERYEPVGGGVVGGGQRDGGGAAGPGRGVAGRDDRLVAVLVVERRLGGQLVGGQVGAGQLVARQAVDRHDLGLEGPLVAGP